MAADAIGASRVVLWDPVVRGVDYVAELEALHRASLSDVSRFRAPREAAAPEDDDLLLGFHFPQSLRAELHELDLLEREVAATEIALIVSHESPHYSALRTHLGHERDRVAYHMVPPSNAWDRLDRIESVLMPYPVLKTIGAALTEPFP